ncbi:hypothetical protein NAPIS_ORF01737 [Vairimorpha apis BRL 01]|uniref:Uncharacterized protein n=1 Tax=Vairimorpha apis BRL 01 TaxID=1037528 RepID=T0L851_9MICR|nr:hypothetical protein NAPIS_ORF01737 [Vairimorpha apis BRL 01]
MKSIYLLSLIFICLKKVNSEPICSENGNNKVSLHHTQPSQIENCALPKQPLILQPPGGITGQKNTTNSAECLVDSMSKQNSNNNQNSNMVAPAQQICVSSAHTKQQPIKVEHQPKFAPTAPSLQTPKSNFVPIHLMKQVSTTPLQMYLPQHNTQPVSQQTPIKTEQVQSRPVVVPQLNSVPQMHSVVKKEVTPLKVECEETSNQQHSTIQIPCQESKQELPANISNNIKNNHVKEQKLIPIAFQPSHPVIQKTMSTLTPIQPLQPVIQKQVLTPVQPSQPAVQKQIPIAVHPSPPPVQKSVPVPIKPSPMVVQKPSPVPVQPPQPIVQKPSPVPVQSSQPVVQKPVVVTEQPKVQIPEIKIEVPTYITPPPESQPEVLVVDNNAVPHNTSGMECVPTTEIPCVNAENNNVQQNVQPETATYVPQQETIQQPVNQQEQSNSIQCNIVVKGECQAYSDNQENLQNQQQIQTVVSEALNQTTNDASNTQNVVFVEPVQYATIQTVSPVNYCLQNSTESNLSTYNNPPNTNEQQQSCVIMSSQTQQPQTQFNNQTSNGTLRDMSSINCENPSNLANSLCDTNTLYTSGSMNGSNASVCDPSNEECLQQIVNQAPQPNDQDVQACMTPLASEKTSVLIGNMGLTASQDYVQARDNLCQY